VRKIYLEEVPCLLLTLKRANFYRKQCGQKKEFQIHKLYIMIPFVENNPSRPIHIDIAITVLIK